MTEKPVLAIIGGSGLYNFESFKDVEAIDMDTPFGKPSSAITIGTLAGKRVAFLARHGIGHILMPSEVNYRANIYALKAIGVQHIVSVSACGSLREDLAPGDIIIPDQVLDFTRDRPRTFFGEGMVVHISVADPYCAELGKYVYESIKATGTTVHQGGAYITIEGPRFSTKAESHLYRSWGMSVIGMTAIPEVFLAREAELCYATMAHVTDYDVWHVSEEPVTVEMVINVLQQNTATAQQAIQNLVRVIPDRLNCQCEHALENAILTQPEHISTQARSKYALLINKYINKIGKE